MQSAFKALTGEIDTRKFGTAAAPTSVQNLAYTWDLAGNFKVRNDLRQQISETANYDALNRLTQMIGPAGTLTVAYDAIGNITSRSDVNSGSTWKYHDTKKNAVTAGGSINYSYDANGNMTSRNGVTQSWTSANLPATLATSTLSTQFSYAPDRSRWKQVANYSGVTETTLFIGGLLERHTTTTPARTHWKHLIATPSGEVQYVRRSDGTTDTFYVPSDHLGSADAVLNSAGTVLVRTSFNAWGARRDDDWVGAPSSTELQQIADTTRHGFTGHDMLDNVGLVHMNGRVYDPAIGRFVSADPFVVPMLGTQGLNRYAYTLNSPLSYTDPSGFVPSADPHTPDHYQPRDPGRPCCSGRGPTGGPNGGAGAGRNDGSTQGHRGWSQTPDDLNVSTPSTVNGSTLGNAGGWKYVPGEPQKIGQELSPVGYIVRRQTMGVLDFVQYKPGLKQLPEIDKLPQGPTIEKMMKKAVRDIYKKAGQEAGNAVARGVRVDELYRVYMSYDIYSGDQAYYEPGHEPLCCRNDVSFKVVTPGAQPVLRLIDWRYEMSPSAVWHPSESWVAPPEIGHGWELYTPVSPFTP
jgi:RHS repeat-associated protein